MCRWFDKSFQLIVTPEAYAAINFEHSWGDGVAVLRFFQSIYKDKRHVMTTCEPTLEGVRRLEFKLPKLVETETQSAVKEIEETCSSLTVDVLQYQRYGKDFIKEMKLSPDAVLQLAIQVCMLCWEGPRGSCDYGGHGIIVESLLSEL